MSMLMWTVSGFSYAVPSSINQQPLQNNKYIIIINYEVYDKLS